MGKPFNRELETLNDTYLWTLEQDIQEMAKYIINDRNKPTIIIGSGGSLSACYFASILFQKLGIFSKAITPLELFNSCEIIKGSNLIFISASGRNSDILFAFKTAIKYEPHKIACVCMKENTPLSNLSKNYASSRTFAFPIPSGKDGFLATNSLVAFFTLFMKCFSSENVSNQLDSTSFRRELKRFEKSIDGDYSFVVLYSGYGQPVAVDLESKFVEAALGNISTSDYRNFAHGRHHWFDKRGKKSAIIAIVTPNDSRLAYKTVSLMPSDIPVLFLETDLTDGLASIDLLIKSFYLVQLIGDIQKIDPGKPGVPDYGSKLYHLSYSSLLPSQKNGIDNFIIKKAFVKTIGELSENERKYWINSYNKFIDKLSSTEFGSIIFDYDGTLCSSENRLKGITKEVTEALVKFLSKGFLIGIATGRGQSVRKDLQGAIPKKFWGNILVGYYNGSAIGLLNENNIPNKSANAPENLLKLYEELDPKNYSVPIERTLRPYQLTIQPKDLNDWGKAKQHIIQLIKVLGFSNIEFLESSHSIDIVFKPMASKLNMIAKCEAIASAKGLPKDCLCIGDRGQWPGNDYELLSTPYSLSVDEVSSSPESCWNISDSGIRNIPATLRYLEMIHIKKNGLIFKAL